MQSFDELVKEGLARLCEGDCAAGIACLEQAVERQPDATAGWGCLASALMTAGRHEEALRALERMLALEPDRLDARWRVADRLVRLGRLEEAEAQYRAVLARDGACHEARYGLRYIEYLKRRPAEGAAASNGPPEATGSGQAGRDRKIENERRALAHFERGDTRLSSRPTHVQVEMTDRCNAQCVMCVRADHPLVARDLAPEALGRIEAEILPLARRVNVAGFGEAVMARQFDAFSATVVRHGARLHLTTNGTALSIARLERLARGCTHLVVSVDGATAGMFEAVRRGLRFERVLDTLRLYKKLRDLYPEGRSELWINFVAMRRNIEELPAVVDLAADLDAQMVVVIDMDARLLSAEMQAEHPSRHPELANRLFDEAAERARRRGIRLQLPPKYLVPEDPPSQGPPSHDGGYESGPPSHDGGYESGPPSHDGGYESGPPSHDGGYKARAVGRRGRWLPERGRFPRRCSEPWITTYVACDGRVQPCCAHQQLNGDLHRLGFEAIWNGRRYRWLRRRIRTFLPPLECRSCVAFWGINAGNPSVVQAREGVLVNLLYAAEIRARQAARKARALLNRARSAARAKLGRPR